MAQLDVYRDWLNISETVRPLNHYQLLRVKLFEDDPSVIRASYRQLNAHVRKYAAGEFGVRSQRLLNELAQAMLCLTDNVRKTEYDASLGRTGHKAAKGKTLEELLLSRKVLTSQQLEKARRYAKTIGVEIRDAVMQQKLAPAEQVMQAFAESIGLPYLELDDIQLDEQLLPKVPAVMARQQSLAPLLAVDGRVLVVTPNVLSPEIEDQLRLRLGAPVRTVLCAPATIHALIGKHYPREAAAAEMAAGPPKATKSAAVAAQPAAVAPAAKPAAKPAAPADRAAVKRKQRMVVLVAFCWSVIGFMIVAGALGYTLRLGMIKSVLFALVFGAITAGIAYIFTELKSP